MNTSGPGRIPRRRLLGGSFAGIVGAVAGAVLGFPPRSRSQARADGDGFLVLAVGDPLPQDLEAPSIPMILERGGVEATLVSEIRDQTEFSRRARILMRCLPTPPVGYRGPVYRVAENTSGKVPMASVTYELPDDSGRYPRSIISIIGKPRGAHLYPFPIRGQSFPRSHAWGQGHEVRGRNNVNHFWYEGDNLYIFMHINYDDGKPTVPLAADRELISSLQQL